MNIKIFAMDVDGTLTDGKIYMGIGGEMLKAFHVKDGQGIRLLQQNNIMPAIITNRSSSIVEKRADELEITDVYQGVTSKKDILENLCKKYSVSPAQTAFVGDDLGDLEAIRFSGISFCPSDAVQCVKEEATYILNSKGGEGAVREAIERLLTL